MIAILIVYASVAVAEWRYIHRSKRKKRTYYIIFGSMSFLFLLSEFLFAIKQWFQMSVWIEAVFGPLERVLLGQW
ncbi:hypothetical protein [Cohnella rhizosphaerae]|uniref:Uncharacterized protein n=1 Tax=Cohnella rhizosphaerae TaxID=1457232 RepID=A0A9X4L161_9BACL|nr:hypothetical protein [Cohnella rhizosphaerae]MDG0814231.1 hypothetical protein [Cohnella rhizosphaerae]